ncbi:glucosyltransferase [Acidipropionibacterium jensenii]|uniref:Glucosyltransferase n=1 Tax=Acidipropionibacterium jensenii TaxID=1749 RepID=A0A3Q9UFR6_9ACTN|nr:glycosyltransferase [Acidipropionibacterium jensenii]AZZ40496.1 glucosyltransferase [Acidipropionibacterium jensenii]
MTSASIVIPSFRGAKRLPRLLAALAAQTSSDWEAIVVIDGDLDGSQQVVDRYSHLPVRSIVFPQNRGRVAALNAGFEAATGDVLIRCDDDLEPAPDYVAQHVASHSGDAQGTIGIYRNVLVPSRYTTVYGEQADTLFRQAAYSASPDQRWRFWAGNVSVTRDTWNRVGGYDPRYRTYGWEDVDYGFRLREAGIPVVIDTSLETDHHAAAVTTPSRVRRAYHSGEARRLFDQIHGPGASSAVRPVDATTWNRLVGATANQLTYRRASALSEVVDTAIRGLPGPVGRKLVALLVEAAGVAGYRNTEDVPNDI